MTRINEDFDITPIRKPDHNLQIVLAVLIILQIAVLSVILVQRSTPTQSHNLNGHCKNPHQVNPKLKSLEDQLNCDRLPVNVAIKLKKSA